VAEHSLAPFSTPHYGSSKILESLYNTACMTYTIRSAINRSHKRHFDLDWSEPDTDHYFTNLQAGSTANKV